MYHWWEHPLDQRARPGGEIGLNGKFYLGGEVMPFYVPRDEMPQIHQEDYGALLAYLKKLPVGVERKVLPPTMLKPHQRINKIRVESLKSNPAILNSECWVSKDLYILDGNHRWEGHMELGTNVPVYIMEREFEEAMKVLFDFPLVQISRKA